MFYKILEDFSGKLGSLEMAVQKYCLIAVNLSL